jgi:hypothetical protein
LLRKRTRVRAYDRRTGHVRSHERGYEAASGIKKAISQAVPSAEWLAGKAFDCKHFITKESCEQSKRRFIAHYKAGVVDVVRLGETYVAVDWHRYLDSSGYDFGKPELVMMAPDEYVWMIRSVKPTWRYWGAVDEDHLKKMMARLKKPDVYEWSSFGDMILLSVNYKNGRPVWDGRDQEGMHRVEAARRLGFEKVPVVLFDQAFSGMERYHDGWEDREIKRGRFKEELE